MRRTRDRARTFYIKLGKGGNWAEDSIKNGLLRFGWSSVPLQLLRSRDWGAVDEIIRSDIHNAGAAKRDLNALRGIIESTPEDTWITFHGAKMWWGRVDETPAEEDGLSKYRRLLKPWSDQAVDGRVLVASQIPGSISAVQGFRGTACTIKDFAAVGRVISGEVSEPYRQLEEAKADLATAVAGSLRQLHWKDFETLVDLVFRHAGWRRISLLGETLKFADLELEDPITRDRYQVQVKAKADLPGFQAYATEFSAGTFRRLYFVVHSPTPKLEHYQTTDESIVLIGPTELARMVVDAGLTGWLMDRIR